VPLPQVAPRQNAGGFGPGTPGGPHVPQYGPPQQGAEQSGPYGTPGFNGHAHGPHPA
jgi:MoxR-like ATPase